MSQVTRRRSRALAVLLSGLLGCRDATAPAACDGALDVQVSPGITPTISWSPKCGISELVVFGESPNAVVPGPVLWRFTVSELAPLGPGVRYGSTPHAATESTPAQPLRAGTTYHVMVMYVVGGDGIAAQGTRTFVP